MNTHKELEQDIIAALTPANINVEWKQGQPRPRISFDQIPLDYVMPDVMALIAARNERIKAELLAAVPHQGEIMLHGPAPGSGWESAEAAYIMAWNTCRSDFIRAINQVFNQGGEE